MSAWRIALQELHELGGKAPARKFGLYHSRFRLRAMGLADFEYSDGETVWALTQLGRDVADGRVIRYIAECRKEGHGRGPDAWRATWLRALPRANEIQL